MYPSPSPSPSPSPGPAYLYHGSHGHGSGSGGAGGGAGNAGGAGGLSGMGGSSNGPFGGLNGSGGGGGGFAPVGRFPSSNLGGWGHRSHHPHHSHQQNPSLSSLPGSLGGHSGGGGAGNGPPSSPGYGSIGNHHHHHPHHHGSTHGPSGLSHMSSPGHINAGPSHGMGNPSAAAAAADAAAAAAAGANASPHWQQQLIKAEISRQSASPHHHARAAALAARSATSAAVTISDPNKGIHMPSAAAANGLSLSTSAGNKNGAANEDGGEGANGHANGKSGPGSGNGPQTWTTIDMGGLGLKNLAREVFRYEFLTSLFVNHNSLTTLSPDIIRLRNLTVLDASGNKLVSLPAEMGMLTNLKELFLFDNNLSTLPPELGTLHQLELLGIEGNPLSENLRSLVQRDGTQALIAYLRDSCPVPLPPPEREWISIDTDLPAPRDSSDGPEPPTETFNLLCYNVLCERYATASMYGYTPSWALAWDYRKEFILQEVMSYSADICCLQEVDSEQYEDYFLHHLSQQDYEGVYWPKSRARTMRDEERRRVDGCATFFKSSKFALIEKQLIEFNQIALQRPDFKKTEDMFNRVMTKDNIAVVALLENRESGSRVIVANAHIHWDPEFRDVKLVQVAMLMDELEKIGQRFAKFPAKLDVAEGFPPAPKYSDGTKIPTIICGDFNSVPDSGVYDFLSSGSIAGDHEDFMSHIYGNYTAEGLGHKLPLKSAYSNVGELPFTNYTPSFEGVIDYIWYNTNALAVTGLLGEVEKEYLDKVVGFPNAHFPSDHICILSEFRVKHPQDQKKAQPFKADFGNTGSSNSFGGAGGRNGR